MSKYKVPISISWSDSCLGIFRILREGIKRKGFTSANLFMLLCVIAQNTFVFNDYFADKDISENNLSRVIRSKYRHCKKQAPGLIASLRRRLNTHVFEVQSSDGTISLQAEDSLMEILIGTIVRCKKAFIDPTIELEHIIGTMFINNCPELKEFFSALKLDYEEARQHFLQKEEKSAPLIIPAEFSEILSPMNNNVDISKPCEVLNLDKECQSVWDIMLKKENHNVLILGNPGCGKTSLIEKIVYDISAKLSPTQLFGYKIVSLNVYRLLDELSKSIDNVKALVAFLASKSNVILCIENINEILVYQEDSGLEVLSILEPLWKSGNIIVIGTSNLSDYYDVFSTFDISLSFQSVILLGTHVPDMYDVLKSRIESLSMFHNVEITPEMAKYALLIGFCFFTEAVMNYGLHPLMRLLDISMATANRLFHKSLAESDVLQNCYLSYDIWNKMTEDQRREIAIHEAGHYFVAVMCRQTTGFDPLAISIVPCGNYLGTTFAIQDSRAYHKNTLDSSIDYMAFLLGGREAEVIFKIETNDGVVSDLVKVTEYAFQTIEALDLLQIKHRNQRYINSTEELKLSDEDSREMNAKASELIENASKRANYLISTNQDVLLSIVDALLQKPIMTAEEVDKIWQDTVSKRVTSKNSAKSKT